MRGAIEISMYPLNRDYVAPIKAFISRLNGHADLQVETSATSTRVWGDYDRVMAAVTAEMREVHVNSPDTVVFVLKVLCARHPDPA